eukprot:gene9556-10543_t
MRDTIPVPKRVAVALWWLANGGSYRSVGQTFGISRSIVCRITKDFVGVMVLLRDRYIRWPRSLEECTKCIKTFENLSPLPNILGAVDGTHIEIIAPENSTVDFFNRKQRYSISCQGVCDGNLIFLSMSAGFPGSIHDSRMLRNSWVYAEATSREILRIPVFMLNSMVSIAPYLVGDAAYPLSDWLIKPFPYEKNMQYRPKMFNLALSQARVSIERAFGMLKSRWRILLGKLQLEPSFAADVVTTCTVLHNICQKRGEQLDETLLELPCQDDNNVHDTGASSNVVRDHLITYLEENSMNDTL